MQTWLTQVRKGLSDLCIMAALRGGESYGYEVFQWSAQSDWPTMPEPTVYRVLSQLAREGLVKVRTVRSSQGPPRRYYRLSRSGESRFREMAAQWRQLSSAVDNLLKRRAMKRSRS